MPTTTLRHGLPIAVLLTLACSSPAVAPPLEVAAPNPGTEARLEEREGSAFRHQIQVTSEAPPVALALLGAPSGLTIDATGQLAWTPDFDQGRRSHRDGRRTDGQAMPRTTRLDLTVIVANTNRAPTPPDVTTDATLPVVAGETFTVSASATDPDGDAITYSRTTSGRSLRTAIRSRSRRPQYARPPPR